VGGLSVGYDYYMKISVVVIAHNEELHIGRCIESLLQQTRQPDEILVISHNSTDRTEEVARQYPVKVIPYHGPAGSHIARIKGFEEATGDYILCVDGDASAKSNWVATLTSLLARPSVVLVGSWVRMTGTIYIWLGSLCWFLFAHERATRPTDWLFGASFGIHGSDKEKAIHALTNGHTLSGELSLSVNPDDFWLALFFATEGTVVVTNRTNVLAQAKERTSWDSFVRGVSARRVRRVMLDHTERNPLSL